MRIWQPGTVQDLFAILRDESGSELRFAAGCTALQLDWAKGLPKPSTLLSLARVAEMSGVAIGSDTIRIGAGTTLGALIREPEIASNLPLLDAALRAVAGPSIRNLATIGGNIAGRTGCLLPALLALEAELEMAAPIGSLRLSLLDWLHLPRDPLDLIIAIHLPRRIVETCWTHRKVGLRAAFTPSVISVAGCLDIQAGQILHARLAVGGGIVPPTRLIDAETKLTGCEAARVDWVALHACLMETIRAPDDDFRTGAYRRRVAANALVHGLTPSSYRQAEAGHPRRSARPPSAARREAHPARGRPPHLSLGDRLVAGDESLRTAPLSGEVTLGRAAQPERWHIRPDIAAKVEGRLTYLTDMRRPDMLVGRILRAGLPHARILRIDTEAAERLPGVACVVTHRDIAGKNAYGIVIQDQPALCHDKVRHCGDPVAAVAAIDAATADRALALIRVDYEPLPIVDDMDQALSEAAMPVHAGGNLQRHMTFARGDVDAAFERAAHVVEDVYVTPRQMHGFMETEGGYALIEEDGMLSVHVGGQHGSRDRMQLSRILGLPEDRIRVVTSPTGGAFGGKDELTVQPVLALLALKSGQPVRLQLPRAESVLAGQKRNPMRIRMKTGCDAEGRLVAQQVDLLAEGGAYASLGPGVLETALEHAGGPYLIENVRTEGRLAYTNNGVCGAFRGFGANQMSFALECQMDRLAALAGLSPVEIRARNLRKPGMKGYLGQDVAKSERIAEMLSAAQASPLWRAAEMPFDDGEWITATGMALNYQGNGLGSVVPDPAGGRLALGADGLIEGAYGLDEMGQGLCTLIQATVAAELGCGRDDVRPVIGDTALAPESGSTTASRGTSVVWTAARMAGPDFSRQMRVAAARAIGCDPELLKLANGGFTERGSNSGEILLTYHDLAALLPGDERPSVTVAYDFPKNDYTAGNARYIFAFGAALARVAVSRVTGEVRVLDIHQHTAAGPVMDVAAYLGQIEGGAVQGLGFTLTEDAPMRAGRYLTTNLDSYMLPSIADTPRRMSVFALEDLDPDDPLGPRGTGELGIGAVTPAIANAVAQITGQWPAVTPFLPEQILAHLASMP